jgi:hypothetical protein
MKSVLWIRIRMEQHHFGKPDLHQNEKPDPDPHLSKKRDPNPHQRDADRQRWKKLLY